MGDKFPCTGNQCIIIPQIGLFPGGDQQKKLLSDLFDEGRTAQGLVQHILVPLNWKMFNYAQIL
jgi:hypothetical protein